MPIYDYHCSVCNHSREVAKPLALLDRVERCTNCDFAMNRQVSAPMVRGDYPGYDCPVTGKWIEGKRAHEENLKKHSCRVLEGGETREFQRRRKDDEKKLDDAVDATVEQFVEALPAAKKEQLAQELAAGADVQVTRQGV